MDYKQCGASPIIEKECLCKARTEAKPRQDYADPQPKVHLYELSYRFIAYILGLLLAFESMLLLACCGVSRIYGESDMMSFIVSFAISLSASIMFILEGGGHGAV